MGVSEVDEENGEEREGRRRRGRMRRISGPIAIHSYPLHTLQYRYDNDDYSERIDLISIHRLPGESRRVSR